MKAEALLQNPEVKRALKPRMANRKVRPEQVLCDLLNGLSTERRHLVAQHLR